MTLSELYKANPHLVCSGWVAYGQPFTVPVTPDEYYRQCIGYLMERSDPPKPDSVEPR